MCLRRGPQWMVLGVFVALMAPAAWAQEEGTGATVTVNPPKERRGTGGEHEGHLIRELHSVFGFGPAAYAIAHKVCVDPAHGGKVVPLEGYIGMPRPSSCNWYHSGFIFIQINGRDIGTTPISSMMAVESGERAIMDMVWHDEAADVRVRFFGLPGRDWLGVEVAVDPVQTVESLVLKLRCYPSFFTSWHKRDGARRIQTPSQLVEQGASVDAPLPENWWAVYYDEIFDVAKGEGEGPCAMLAVPVEGAQMRFAPGSYAVETDISFPSDTRRVRMAFWDLKGRTNEEVLADIQARAGAVREELAGIDLTPRVVAEFDVAAAREDLETALANEHAREALADKIELIQQWLDEYAPQLEGRQGAPGIAAEEQLLQSIDVYNSFKWEVKLMELIYDL